MKASLPLVTITQAAVFVTISDLLARFIIYMKMVNRCAAAGFLTWPVGALGRFISMNSVNASPKLLAFDFPI